MNSKILLCLCFVILIFQFSLVNAFEFHKTEIELDETGDAIVRNMFFINSTNNTFFLPAFSPRNIDIFDEFGELNYSLSNEGIFIDIRKKEDYSFTVEYFSNILTSKNANIWEFSYDFYKLRNFDKSEVTLVLPQNTKLLSFLDNGIVYLDNGYIKIDWNIPVESLSERINVKYTFEMQGPPDNKFESANWFIYVVIFLLIFVVTFLVISKFKPKFKLKKDVRFSSRSEKINFSKRQEDLLKTLTEGEQKIISELFKSKKGLTQKKLRLITGIPKATLSRTLRKLEVRNFIEIRSLGGTNLISLTSWFLEK
jgi:hypothetical protein